MQALPREKDVNGDAFMLSRRKEDPQAEPTLNAQAAADQAEKVMLNIGWKCNAPHSDRVQGVQHLPGDDAPVLCDRRRTRLNATAFEKALDQKIHQVARLDGRYRSASLRREGLNKSIDARQQSAAGKNDTTLRENHTNCLIIVGDHTWELYSQGKILLGSERPSGHGQPSRFNPPLRTNTPSREQIPLSRRITFCGNQVNHVHLFHLNQIHD
jgi:hypothetical protein